MPNKKKTGKQPYIPLYIGDWEQDTNMLSLEAEGGWLKVVFKMFKNGQNGVYKVSTKALQILWRKNEFETGEIVKELKDASVCDIISCDGFYEFTNRRMKKEKEISDKRTKAVQNRYKPPTKGVQPSEYEYENSITTPTESNTQKEEIVCTSYPDGVKKKSTKIVGVKKPKMKNENSEPFWKKLVSTYFSFCVDKFSEKPSFDGSAPSDMHRIIESLRQRAEEKKFIWDERTAVERWRGFLGHAYLDDWLSKNWLLSNLNRHKDKIFFNLTNAKNGSHQQTSPANGRVAKSAGAEKLGGMLKAEIGTHAAGKQNAGAEV